MDPELYLAATTGDNDRIIELNDRINQVSEGQHTVLHLAALCNKFISVSAILKNFPDLLQRMNSSNETALHLAARKGYFLVVELLIRKSKELNYSCEDFIRKVNVDGDTALHLAAQNNHKKVVEEIVKADPTDKHSRNKKSETPLYLAAMRGHKDVVKIILGTCTDAAVDGPEGKTALHAAVISRDADCVKTLLQMKEDLVNKVDNKGWTAMHHAAYLNCVSLLQIIEEKNATPYNNQNLPQRETHMDNPLKKTALHIAASEGHISTVLELMRIYAPPSTICADVDEDGQNILHIAVDQNHIEVVKCILQYCPEIEQLLNKGDKNGNTPLHLLVMRGFFIPELIQHPGVNRIAKNNGNFTPSELLYFDEHIIGDQLQIKEALEEVQNGQQRNFWGRKSRPILNTRESLVPPSKRSRKDAKFMIDKTNLMTKKVKLYRERTSTQIIVTALITTVTFTVGFAMPGGYHQTEKIENQGSAVLSKKKAFNICMTADAIALLFSTSSLFFYFISSLYQDPLPVSRLNSASVVFNIVSVVAMMGTFMAGTYVVLPHSTPLAFIMLGILGLFFPCVCFLLLKLIVERTVIKKLKV